MFITYFKLSFLTFKYLFYYICDIFGSQNPAHDLAYQVPIIPFWASLFIVLVNLELLSSSPLQNVNTLYLASLPLLYITIYLVAMYHRYQKDMRTYDEVMQKNLDFIKTCIFPISGLITLLGFYLAASGNTLNSPYDIFMQMYKIINNIGIVVARWIPSEYYQALIKIFSGFISVIIIFFFASLPYLIFGYLIIRILQYRNRSKDDYKELWESIKIRNWLKNWFRFWDKYNTAQELRVKKPLVKEKVTVKPFFKTRYVYYETGRIKIGVFKKYDIPKSVCIGKEISDNTEMMIPNVNYLRLFPNAKASNDVETSLRSDCLYVGAYFALCKIISESSLDILIRKTIGENAELFMDLIVYSIMTENNATLYYQTYAYNHPCITDNVKNYSDLTITSFLRRDMNTQRNAFLDEWVGKQINREKLYISFDLLNKTNQEREIGMTEVSYLNEGLDNTIFNYSIAFDHTNNVPLFYEAYPSYKVDESWLQFMKDKARKYGYKHISFILDYGYYDKETIHYMDSNGYDFIIMINGLKTIVSEVVNKVQGTFEQDEMARIKTFRVYGTTVKRPLYSSDKKERYFHVFYDKDLHMSECEKIKTKIKTLKKQLDSYRGMKVRLTGEYSKYIDLQYYYDEDGEMAFCSAKERTEIINQEMKLCGYYVIITSMKMTAEEALDIYKSRDSTAKIFWRDKSCTGDWKSKSYTYESEFINNKIFIEFVALIIRNRVYNLLKEKVLKGGKIPRFMTVSSVLNELDKIEMIKGNDDKYHLKYTVTEIQERLLNMFGLSKQEIWRKSLELSDKLAQIDVRNSI